MKIDFQYAWSQLINNWPLFWYGIKMTIAFAVVGTLAGLIIGLIIGAIRCVPLDPLDKPVTRFFKRLGRFTAAYMAEIIRSGIQSIDPGQMEAAKSLGMTNTQTMISIIFPQAIKNTFPSLGNQFIVNIKDSCMLNAISVVELFFQAQSVAGTNMRYIEVYLVVAILYLILTTVATFVLNYVEKKINKTNTVTIKDNCA